MTRISRKWWWIEPAPGEFFGFASMLEQTPHQTDAVATDQTVCIEVDRNDILVLLQRKPHAGMDMLAVLGHQFHASQQLVRVRANRHPNEIIEEQVTLGERIADTVATFGGSWTFIILFGLRPGRPGPATNVALRSAAWDPYPFILLNLFLSMLAAIQAPVIMMSQNRQDKKDRLRGELDYDVNRRAHRKSRDLPTSSTCWPTASATSRSCCAPRHDRSAAARFLQTRATPWHLIC